MVKAKFGALALTVLMGLGAVSPLHGVTEAHALNAPVANSAQQKTVVSTTDDSDGVMSYKDKESGKTFVSEDNGASWMSEEDYNNSHPAINYEWWTYDEYKEWLEQEKKMDCQHFFRQIFLGYFSDIVQAFDTLRKNVCGDDYTSLHNPIVLSSVLPAYGMFHSIQILFL